MGYFGGYFGGGTADSTEPTVSIVSPTPGLEAGDPGGMPSNYAAAKTTPIVLEVTDADPGNRLIIVVFMQDAGGDLDHPIEEVVYRGGYFRGGYLAAGSWQESITDGVRLHCLRAEGWPGSDAPSWRFEVDAVDQAGNEA